MLTSEYINKYTYIHTCIMIYKCRRISIQTYMYQYIHKYATIHMNMYIFIYEYLPVYIFIHRSINMHIHLYCQHSSRSSSLLNMSIVSQHTYLPLK